ncbi:sowahb [Pungitius sinensis]
MATEFTQDTLLHFLQSRGGSAKNSDLLLHFRNFIRDHADQNHNRELFKQFVNSVATVRQVDGVSYVFLRRKFKGQVPGGGGGERGFTEPRPSPPTAGRYAEPPPKNAAPKPQSKGVMPPAPPAVTDGKTILPAAGILLLNNNNNNVATNMNLKQRQEISPSGPGRPPAAAAAAAVAVGPIPQRTDAKNPAPGQRIQVAQPRGGPGLPPGTTPVVMSLGETRQQVAVPQNARGREACLQIEGGLHQGAPVPHLGLQPQGTPRRMRYRPSYKTAVSYDDDEDDYDDEEEEEVELRQSSSGGKWPPAKPLLDTMQPICASSPSIVDPHGHPIVFSSSSSERQVPKVLVQNAETMPPGGPGRSMQSGVWPRGQWAGTGLEPVSGPVGSTRSILPLDEERFIPSSVPRGDVSDHQYPQHVGVRAEPRQRPTPRQGAWLSSSQSSIFSPSYYESSSGDQLSFGSHRGPGGNHNYEDPQARAGETVGGSQIQEAMQQTQGKKLESLPMHHSTGHLHDNQEATTNLAPFHCSSDRLQGDAYSTAGRIPWHLSTGDLHADREEVESSEGSTSSRTLLRPPDARRLSSKVRSRMCRSLGTNLDQLLQEEVRVGGGSEMARLNRLHLISSSLSLRYDLSSSSSLSSCCTPPRCPSPAHLDERTEARTGRSPPTASPPAQREGSSRQSLVPLEPREHAWMVKAAAGAWPDIYTMFREDSSLLNKHDFISGFTVLHWIAKHGDHRVLNTLWYGVQKAGLTFNINAKSTCGHTPLHVAAIHNSKNILRLLVTNFNADVKLRDTAGKKPWQYLSRAVPPDIFQLLGAPLRPAGGGEGIEEHNRVQHQQPRQRQRRRHHLSFASQGERPPVMTGTTRVKRSSSIAAFLKHKSLQRLYGHQSDSSV